MKVTGERETAGGFNPTRRRHVAAYALSVPRFGPGKLLDLGCGVGHSYHLLGPRETVGVDVDPGALAGQERKTVVSDMRELPFADASFASVLSVQSLEHVPDPERAVAEVARVLQPGQPRAGARHMRYLLLPAARTLLTASRGPQVDCR